MSKSLLSGPKFNQTHQTYLDGAVNLIEILKNDDSVKKIMLGVIEPTSPGIRHCKVRSVEGNLVTIVFRDVSAIQVIRVVSKEKSIIKKIEEYANTVNPKRKSKREKKPKKTSVSNSLNRTSAHPLKPNKIKPTLRDKWPI